MTNYLICKIKVLCVLKVGNTIQKNSITLYEKQLYRLILLIFSKTILFQNKNSLRNSTGTIQQY